MHQEPEPEAAEEVEPPSSLGMEELLSPSLDESMAGMEHDLEEIRASMVEIEMSMEAWQAVEEGDLERAVELFEARLQSARARKDRVAQAQTLEGLASALGLSGETAEARRVYKDLLSLASELDDQALKLRASCFLAQNKLQSGEIEAAGTELETVLASAEEARAFDVMALAHFSLGLIRFSEGDYEKTVEHWEKQLQHDPTGGSATLEGLAWAHASVGSIPKAIELAENFLKISGNSKNLFDRISAWTTHGYVLWRADRHEEAETSLRRAIEVYEQSWEELGKDRSRVSSRDFYSAPYELLQRVQVSRIQPDAALSTSESSRARAFLQRMTERSILLSEAADLPPPMATSIDLNEIQSLARRTAATYVIYEILFDSGQLLASNRFGVTRRNLETDLWVWVVDPKGRIRFESVPLGHRDQLSLSKQIETLRIGWGVGDRGAAVLIEQSGWSSTLGALSRLLVTPIESYLPEPGSKIIVIPRGPLFLVPFAALPKADGSLLIDSYTVSMAPSLSIAKALMDRRQAPNLERKNFGSLVVGDPTLPPGHRNLRQLPGAELEARKIGKILGVDPLIGPEATRSAVIGMLERARRIHLATHGLLEFENPDGFFTGAFVLASDGDGDENEGLLTADDIAGISLRAELVVASACDTGGGRLSGDGVIGLSRSLLVAGAQAVLVSLWRIDDAATEFLMERFYRHLEETPDVPAALRLAMLESRERYPHPRFWASFVAIDAPADQQTLS